MMGEEQCAHNKETGSMNHPNPSFRRHCPEWPYRALRCKMVGGGQQPNTFFPSKQQPNTR
eukprot:5454058-Amphidinium_carterae.1